MQAVFAIHGLPKGSCRGGFAGHCLAIRGGDHIAPLQNSPGVRDAVLLGFSGNILNIDANVRFGDAALFNAGLHDVHNGVDRDGKTDL